MYDRRKADADLVGPVPHCLPQKRIIQRCGDDLSVGIFAVYHHGSLDKSRDRGIFRIASVLAAGAGTAICMGDKVAYLTCHIACAAIEPAVYKHSAADAGAIGDTNKVAAAASGAKGKLAHSCAVDIILDEYGNTQRLADLSGQRLVVGITEGSTAEYHYAVAIVDYAGGAYTDGLIAAVALGYLDYTLPYDLRSRGLR